MTHIKLKDPFNYALEVISDGIHTESASDCLSLEEFSEFFDAMDALSYEEKRDLLLFSGVDADQTERQARSLISGFIHRCAISASFNDPHSREVCTSYMFVDLTYQGSVTPLPATDVPPVAGRRRVMPWRRYRKNCDAPAGYVLGHTSIHIAVGDISLDTPCGVQSADGVNIQHLCAAGQNIGSSQHGKHKGRTHAMRRNWSGRTMRGKINSGGLV